MGRRKKESESVHRKNIALSAEYLFTHKSIESTTMDDIAKQAGYSKATIYVYFKNKEEIVYFLVLKSMKILHMFIADAVSKSATIKEKYSRICKALTQYQEQYPLYFTFALSKINVNFNKTDYLPIEKEIFEVGEQINAEISKFINLGVKSGEFQSDMPILQIVFLFWGSLSGLIQIAANKQFYIKKTMNLSKQEFLDFGFKKLFQMISMEGKNE